METWLKSGDRTGLRRLFAKSVVNERNGDVSPTTVGDCLRSDAGARSIPPSDSRKGQEPLSPVPLRVPLLSVTAAATQEPIEQLPML